MNELQLKKLVGVADGFRGSDCDVSLSAEDAQALGIATHGTPTISVKAPLLCQLVDAKVKHSADASEKQQKADAARAAATVAPPVPVLSTEMTNRGNPIESVEPSPAHVQTTPAPVHMHPPVHHGKK